MVVTHLFSTFVLCVCGSVRNTSDRLGKIVNHIDSEERALLFEAALKESDQPMESNLSAPPSVFCFPNSGLLEHGHHPDESGSPGRSQAHLPDLRRHPGREPEGPPRPQELGHQLLVQPGKATPRAGTPGGRNTYFTCFAYKILRDTWMFLNSLAPQGLELALVGLNSLNCTLM